MQLWTDRHFSRCSLIICDFWSFFFFFRICIIVIIVLLPYRRSCDAHESPGEYYRLIIIINLTIYRIFFWMFQKNSDDNTTRFRYWANFLIPFRKRYLNSPVRILDSKRFCLKKKTRKKFCCLVEILNSSQTTITFFYGYLSNVKRSENTRNFIGFRLTLLKRIFFIFFLYISDSGILANE